MAINHSDKCWWKAFCQEVKRAFRRNDLEQKAHLYGLYERHMTQRQSREYHYYKRLEYKAMKSKGLVDKRLGYYDWLNMNRY